MASFSIVAQAGSRAKSEMFRQTSFLIMKFTVLLLGEKKPTFLWHCNIESNSKVVVLLKFLGSSLDMIYFYFMKGTVSVTQRDNADS